MHTMMAYIANKCAGPYILSCEFSLEIYFHLLDVLVALNLIFSENPSTSYQSQTSKCSYYASSHASSSVVQICEIPFIVRLRYWSIWSWMCIDTFTPCDPHCFSEPVVGYYPNTITEREENPFTTIATIIYRIWLIVRVLCKCRVIWSCSESRNQWAAQRPIVWHVAEYQCAQSIGRIVHAFTPHRKKLYFRAIVKRSQTTANEWNHK